MIGQGLSRSFRLLALSLVSAVLVLPACAGPARPASVQPPEMTASSVAVVPAAGTPAIAVAPPRPQATLEPTMFNLPRATLTSSTGLYASPNRAELIVQAAIPAGQTAYVMGRNVTSSHLRVVWSTGVGWVPVSFTDYNGQRSKLEALPVFKREPPRCAVPITTQFDLNSEWTADQSQRIAIVVDLFRSRYGEFPPSSLSLTINGKEVDGTKRAILSQGQFLLIDHQFGPISVMEGDTVGYLFQSPTQEAPMFTAVVLGTSELCPFDPWEPRSDAFTFYARHLSEQSGRQLTEVASYEIHAGLDNSAGSEPLEVEIEFERNFYHKIMQHLNTDDIPAQRVQEMIVGLYRLPLNKPEGTLQTALCPISVVIPAGQKSIITVEWTELWAEGLVSKGETGEGDHLGTYSVFLGYIEPCSLVSQVNTD